MSMWIISRGVVLLILLMEYKVLRDFLLHRSSINNSARLSNKFGGFYFSFKFDISGLLHHVITTIAYRIRDKDTSQSKQNLQSSSMTFIHKTLIIPSVLDSCFISSTVSEVKRYSAYVRRIVADFSHAPLNEYSPSPDDKKQWSLVCKDDEDPSWSTSFKTRRTQKISSALEVLWKTLFLLYLYMIGTLNEQRWRMKSKVGTKIGKAHLSHRERSRNALQSTKTMEGYGGAFEHWTRRGGRVEGS
ncbi:hypothetical protein Tco_1419200 [Tanacetum coccineum]